MIAKQFKRLKATLRSVAVKALDITDHTVRGV